MLFTHTLPLLTSLALFLASFILVFTPFRCLGIFILAIGYGVGLFTGQIDAIACVPILCISLATYLIVQDKKPFLHRLAAQCLFVGLALALGLHLLPGFHNYKVIEAVRLSPDSTPFTFYLNLDKPIAGFALIIACPFLTRLTTWRTWIVVGVTAGALTATLCLGAAWIMGIIAWSPKWPEIGWLWTLNNLFIVAMVEEAFFRGYLQYRLRALFKALRYCNSYGDVIAIIVASILFGCAHWGGGAQWMALAFIGSIGYGTAYYYGGLRAAMLAHFLLNLIHFSAFTYPKLAI